MQEAQALDTNVASSPQDPKQHAIETPSVVPLPLSIKPI